MKGGMTVSTQTPTPAFGHPFPREGELAAHPPVKGFSSREEAIGNRQ